MQSTPAPKETDPHDVFLIKPDVVLAARADKPSAKPAQDGRRSAPQDHATSDVVAGVSAPSLDATFRAAAGDIKVPSGRSAIGKWARRALLGFLFGLCSAVAAAGWTRYGDAAKAMAESWAPKYVLTTSPPQENPGVAEQPSPPVLQAAAADQAAAQPAPPAQSVQSVAPSIAALPPESAQLLQSMSQQIEQLKASIEELRTGQQQISRDISETRTALANPSEQNPRPVMPAHPLSPAAAPARKQRPAFTPAQAAATPMPLQPRPPARAAARREVEPVVRPPMPIHSAFP